MHTLFNWLLKASSFLLLLHVCQYVWHPDVMYAFDQGPYGWLSMWITIVLLLLALLAAIIAFRDFGKKALLGYALALGVLVLLILTTMGSLPAIGDYLLEYVVACAMVVMPLGTILNLGWLLMSYPPVPQVSYRAPNLES